jgi:signal transduction histidine kinase
MKSRNPDEYRDILHSLLDDARSLSSLSNNLLEIARAEQDTHALKRMPVRLDELLLETQSEVELLHPEYQIEIVINDNTDEEKEPTVNGNENLLKLIFTNLIDNACKFSSGKPVKAMLEYNPDCAVITVQDEGIGISPDEQLRIFEPFYRARNAINHPGHGIGLSLIQKIATLHGGSITIDSNENEGTTVKVCLPYTH